MFSRNLMSELERDNWKLAEEVARLSLALHAEKAISEGLRSLLPFTDRYQHHKKQLDVPILFNGQRVEFVHYILPIIEE